MSPPSGHGGINTNDLVLQEQWNISNSPTLRTSSIPPKNKTRTKQAWLCQFIDICRLVSFKYKSSNITYNSFNQLHNHTTNRSTWEYKIQFQQLFIVTLTYIGNLSLVDSCCTTWGRFTEALWWILGGLEPQTWDSDIAVQWASLRPFYSGISMVVFFLKKSTWVHTFFYPSFEKQLKPSFFSRQKRKRSSIDLTA